MPKTKEHALLTVDPCHREGVSATCLCVHTVVGANDPVASALFGQHMREHGEPWPPGTKE